MDRKHSIKLADGRIIENLDLNGNNYISKTPIQENLFHRNCSPIIFNDGEKEEIHDHMELVQITKMNGDYWFVLRDLSEAELAAKKQRADIDYIAMMTDIEL